jgi:hypothetical protein
MVASFPLPETGLCLHRREYLRRHLPVDSQSAGAPSAHWCFADAMQSDGVCQLERRRGEVRVRLRDLDVGVTKDAHDLFEAPAASPGAGDERRRARVPQVRKWLGARAV